MEYNLLTQKDFLCIGDLALHCDLKKLCIAANEALQFDLIPLFCFEFIRDVMDHWDADAYKELVEGGTYRDCHGRLQQSLGLRRVWVYYAYARYLLLNQLNDTANGTVQKHNDYSVPTPLKEVTAFSNKYREMGREAYKGVQAFLCERKAEFPLFDDCNCKKSCRCEGECTCGGRTKKLTGFRFKTIRR